MKTEIKHPFPPIYDQNSKILILGSFPSVKSRENNFFYGHPQNRFWKVLAAVLDKDTPYSNEEKQKLLIENNIALWDSIASCEITGSSDASIRNVVPNDISPILETGQICAIFCNGKKAHALYHNYIEPICCHKAICLPSTSPANATWTLDKLITEYKKALLPYLKSQI